MQAEDRNNTVFRLFYHPIFTCSHYTFPAPNTLFETDRESEEMQGLPYGSSMSGIPPSPPTTSGTLPSHLVSAR
jgi:hypothetical protein